MDLNLPINMHTISTGNNLNLPVDENKIYSSSIYTSEILAKEKSKVSIIKKKRKNKRLNTIDSDFLPDNTDNNVMNEISINIFEAKPNPIIEKIKNVLNFFIKNTPLINYFYLKHKEKEIKQTVETLNDIIQNADELINTAVPYGENGKIYGNIAKNLTNAALIVRKANKRF